MANPTKLFISTVPTSYLPDIYAPPRRHISMRAAATIRDATRRLKATGPRSEAPV